MCFKKFWSILPIFLIQFPQYVEVVVLINDLIPGTNHDGPNYGYYLKTRIASCSFLATLAGFYRFGVLFSSNLIITCLSIKLTDICLHALGIEIVTINLFDENTGLSERVENCRVLRLK